MSNVISLGALREASAIERAIDARDLSMVREFERRCAEAMAEIADLGGVSVDYLEALLRASWALPEQGGVTLADEVWVSASRRT